MKIRGFIEPILELRRSKYVPSSRSKIITTLIIIVLILFFCFKSVERSYISTEQNPQAVGEILAGNEVGEVFQANHNNLMGISFKLATYARDNNGTIVLGIRESIDHKTNIYTRKVDLNTIKDNEYYSIKFPEITNSKNKQYYIFINSLDGKPGNSITVYKNDKDDYKRGHMLFNFQENKGDLFFKVHYNKINLLSLIEDF